eukprot:TRINITY_DN91081_c0_g1_i1.p1 TRINITY_DN91081_c0_g1~~TRINITY_DN91081_c0_g1_i1.p1  ORF type:complete len:725 (+),score=88.03 TRINITY_DN91081_c0_g1_i1:60-2234(+)
MSEYAYRKLPPGVRYAEATNINLEVDQRVVGKLLGKSGASIHEIEKQSWAWISVDQSTKDQGYSVVALKGKYEYQLSACDLVAKRLSGIQEGFQGLSHTEDSKIVLEVEQHLVPHLIGRSGAAIHDIEKRSWAWIQLDQSTKWEGYSTVHLRGKWDYQLKACELIAQRAVEAQEMPDKRPSNFRLRSRSPQDRDARERSQHHSRSRSRDRSHRRMDREEYFTRYRADSSNSDRRSQSRSLSEDVDSCDGDSRDGDHERTHVISHPNATIRALDKFKANSGGEAAGENKASSHRVPSDKKKTPVDLEHLRSLMANFTRDERVLVRSKAEAEGEARQSIDLILKSPTAQPALASRSTEGFQKGAAVCIQWPDHWLDGQVGQLAFHAHCGGSSDTSVILAPCLGFARMDVPCSAVKLLPSGSLAELVNDEASQEQEHGGGQVICFDKDACKYSLRLPKNPDSTGLLEEGSSSACRGASTLNVRPEHIRPHRLLDMPWTHRGAFGQGVEHSCRFLDDDEKLRKFTFYVPPDFKQAGRRWPLLLFLHGSQGGTLLGPRLRAREAGKELRWEPGLDFLAQHFVIVSPRCQWKWNSQPQPWVLQLLRYFLPATWCDTTQVFCTGLSMGAHGLWELASTSNGLFTAVAPVGGYHKAERREQIVKGMKDTPVFVVSAPADTHCPMAPEAELWAALAKQGRKPIVKQHVPGGHSDLFKQAYAKDTELWEWFLLQ